VPHHSTNRKGNIAEAEIAAAAVRLGIDVLKPLVEHGRYDLAFDLGNQLLRVQCKWAPCKGDVVLVNLAGFRYTSQGYVRSTYSIDEIDAVAAYCGDLDRCYLLPASLVADMRAIHLRLSPPRNAQRAALNWADRYELSGAVAQWEERLRGTQEVTGSSPVSSTSHEEHSSVQVGAHVFRNHFGWYMQRAHAGEEILITRRGRPHARLGPPHHQLSALSEPPRRKGSGASGGRIDPPAPYRSHEPTSTR
jgi:prevent-host-death family protein